MTVLRIAPGTVDYDGEALRCSMFVLCWNEATLLVECLPGVLDWLPSCQRCAERLGHDTSGVLSEADLSFEPPIVRSSAR